MRQQAILGLLIVCVLVHVVTGDERTLRREQRRLKKTKTKTTECRYHRADWGECNPSTNLMTRTRTLKKGPSSCDPNVVETKRCRIRKLKTDCRYVKAPWGECDTTTNMKSRTRTLKPKSSASCNRTMTETKPCKKMKCKYSRGGSWGPCNTDTMTKTKVRTLASGSPASCEPTKAVTKKCRTRPTRSECTFGEWSKFGNCVNGMKTKTRSLLKGGERCQKRTTKRKPCH